MKIQKYKAIKPAACGQRLTKKICVLGRLVDNTSQNFMNIVTIKNLTTRTKQLDKGDNTYSVFLKPPLHHPSRLTQQAVFDHERENQ